MPGCRFPGFQFPVKSDPSTDSPTPIKDRFPDQPWDLHEITAEHPAGLIDYPEEPFESVIRRPPGATAPEARCKGHACADVKGCRTGQRVTMMVRPFFLPGLPHSYAKQVRRTDANVLQDFRFFGGARLEKTISPSADQAGMPGVHHFGEDGNDFRAISNAIHPQSLRRQSSENQPHEVGRRRAIARTRLALKDAEEVDPKSVTKSVRLPQNFGKLRVPFRQEKRMRVHRDEILQRAFRRDDLLGDLLARDVKKRRRPPTNRLCLAFPHVLFTRASILPGFSRIFVSRSSTPLHSLLIWLAVLPAIVALYGFVPYTYSHLGAGAQLVSIFHALRIMWERFPDFQHGMLVPPLCAILVYSRRKELAVLPLIGWAPGIFL